MNKEKMFIAQDENNREVAYEMLMTKNVDNTPVIWYTDGAIDEEGSKQVYVSTYERANNTFVLNKIEDENFLNKCIEIFLNEQNSN